MIPGGADFWHVTINPMKNQRHELNLPVLLLAALAMSSLIGCSILQNRVVATEQVEAEPTPIAVPTQLSALTQIASQTCRQVELPVIQTDEAQGDLIAWAPASDRLAMVQPVNQISGWYVGDLAVYDADGQQTIFTSKDQAVFGDLTWSPDGAQLAYIILDQDNGYYTVKTAALSDGTETEVFGEEGAARTNDYSSLKGIQDWSSAAHLGVTSSCGTDCVRQYTYNPVSQSLTQEEEIRQNDDTSLTIENEYSSPDGTWQVTVDDKDNVWLTDTSHNRISLLLVASTTQEVKWSPSSTYLAVRISDRVLIYQVGCTD